MKYRHLLLISLLAISQLCAQPKEKTAQDFFNGAGIQPAKVMLVGTFHFSHPNLDIHKIDKKNMRDILNRKSQQELQPLLDVLRAYQPTRIYLESDDQRWLDSCYNAFRSETLQTQSNERVQIGFRLAKELHLSKVYAVDAGELINDWNNADSVLLAKVLGSDSIANKSHADSLNRIYSAYYNYEDSITASETLLKAFQYLNNPRNLQLSHGAYLSGYFNTLSNYGPDFLSTWWVNRNIRIFNNVLLTHPTGADRILILFGSGHIPLLSQCFESSPEFKMVSFYTAAHQALQNKP